MSEHFPGYRDLQNGFLGDNEKLLTDDGQRVYVRLHGRLITAFPSRFVRMDRLQVSMFAPVIVGAQTDVKTGITTYYVLEIEAAADAGTDGDV